jgi:predicted  nucleic acid-binding Zn-ribbon protein
MDQLTELVTALQEDLDAKKQSITELKELTLNANEEIATLKTRNSELKKEKDDINEQMW